MKRLLVALLAVSSIAASAQQDWQAWIAQLRDQNPKKRVEAVQQLHVANNPAAADYIAPLITDPDDNVQFAAIDAELSFFLNQSIGEEGARSRAQVAFDAGPTVRAAGRAPAVVIDGLIAATADRNARIQFDALHALGVVAEAPISPDEGQRLVSGLQHADPVMRAVTARVLGRLRATASGDALIVALNDKSELVQQFAAESLGWLRHDRAVQALLDRVTFYGKGPRANEALEALARIGHVGARDVFRARLADPDPQARRAAVEGVARINDRVSLERVRAIATNDGANEVRLAGLFALDRFGEPQLTLIAGLVGTPGLAQQATEYLLEAGPRAAPVVSVAIGTAVAASTKVALIHLLGFVGSSSDAPTLEPLVKSPDAAISHAATDALARVRR